jgi:hypothetical protein
MILISLSDVVLMTTARAPCTLRGGPSSIPQLTASRSFLAGTLLRGGVHREQLRDARTDS